MKRPPKFVWILVPAFSILLVVSGIMVGSTLLREHKESAAFEELVSLVESPPPEPQEEGERVSPYQLLKEQNPDFFGWLSIAGTPLDYPVMYTPEEPEYYLHRAFDRTSSNSGVPFVGAGYQEKGKHVIVYGHAMKNGTMFAILPSYEKKEFWEEHPVIQLETLEGKREYRVLGAFYSKVYDQEEESVFRYYQYPDLSDPSRFLEYVEQVQEASLYDTGVNPSLEGSLITLSTCSYHTDDGRFVVVGYAE